MKIAFVIGLVIGRLIRGLRHQLATRGWLGFGLGPITAWYGYSARLLRALPRRRLGFTSQGLYYGFLYDDAWWLKRRLSR